MSVCYFAFIFCILLYVHKQLRSHNVQYMVHDIYLVLFTFSKLSTSCRVSFMRKCVAELELLSGQKFSLTGNEERLALVLLTICTQKNIQIVPRSAPCIPLPCYLRLFGAHESVPRN
jgi:hypothetical protein